MTTTPFEVLIVGGGIGGLTTALALHKQGHDSQIFEQSHLAIETGAALHLAPNANLHGVEYVKKDGGPDIAW
ncbi:hypothetical protein ASPVEDRAFT_84635 [Aspergillus versicolor CBS 583.65]|uniref:FAD dependent oxidoreductase domain-containing protein n=1 Tax=Aspergillus versicolor CBS 583.65 TaxID=1036611 RepID=A0A1L9PNX8_ASPVE|nr:uncharacterized protein ASPVEDRAFT_84635 [Aspergillus versicolor CBS 583.65]OJJ03182.1 hypothetical protein ASPVEDRAFT_84635 [Aspergillus versicolor CBS 583.65]